MGASRWFALVAAVLCVRAAGAGASPDGDAAAKEGVEAERSGQVAPADAWPVEGGCAGHTGESRARPLRGPLVVAWTFDVKGVVEEEPRVWREKCFVCERTPEGKRVLHVVGSRDGVERYRQPFGPGGPLSPAVGERDVVLNGERGLEGWAVGERMLTRRWTTKSPARAFVRRGDALWVVGDHSVVRCSAARGPDRDATTWTERLDVAPAIAVRGDTAFVVNSFSQGEGAFLILLDAGSLALKQPWDIGSHEEGTFSHAAIAAGPDQVFVRSGLPLRTADGTPSNTVWVNLRPNGLPTGGASLVEMTCLPGCPRAGFVAAWRARAETYELVRPKREKSPEGKARYDPFASSVDRPRYVDMRVQPTTVGSVVYMGGICFDADTREVLREDSFSSPFHVVPVRDLLLVAADSRVTAYREARAPPGAAALPLRPPPDVAAGPFALDGVVLALADGSTKTGSFAADLAGQTLTPTAKGGDKTKVRLDAVLAIATATAPRRLLFARDASSAVEGLDAIVEREAGKEWLAAARDALAAGAAADAGAWATEAAARGADEAEFERLRTALDAFVPTPKPPDGKRLAAVRERVAALRARGLAALWSATEQLHADASFALRTALVHEVLRRDPKHAGAAAWVRSGIAAGVPVPEPFEASEWLHFVEAAHRAPVRLLAPPQKGEKNLSHQERQFGSALFVWRPDLIAIESGPLLILTPVQRPARIAKCLATGRQVCDVLEQLFAGGTVKRDTRYPLTHELYETKEEYLQQSTKHRDRREEAKRILESTAGHYDPSDDVSRMFLPADDREFAQVRSTYAHELTHHWVDQRCPRFTDQERAAEGGRGYWVVEGIAEYVSELTLDLAGEAPPAPDPRAYSVDVVAHAKWADLLPWTDLFEMAYDGMKALSDEGQIQVPMRWKLGWSRTLSPRNLFYAQASAASHYLLLAEEGRHREAYLSYLTDHYRGRIEPDAIQRRFGVPPAELGARILAWCRERADARGK